MSLTITYFSGIPIIHPGDDLVAIILVSLQLAGITMLDDNIFELAQEIMSKAEGRLFNLA
jgi:F420-0:gamma-glutamyl ligase